MLLVHDKGHRDEGRAVVRSEARLHDTVLVFRLVLAHELGLFEVRGLAVAVQALERLVAEEVAFRVDEHPGVALHERAADRAFADVQPRRLGLLLDQFDDDALGLGRRRRTVQLLQVQVARSEEGEEVVGKRTEGGRSDRVLVVGLVLGEDDREEIREGLFNLLEAAADEVDPLDARAKPRDIEVVDLLLDAAAAEDNNVEGALVAGRAAIREEDLGVSFIILQGVVHVVDDNGGDLAGLALVLLHGC
mmetsp:Transcript_19448/g.62421  ORF Transcript_19448/g.62421 Transcript_19448/m.62421 type:complete len:248 (+) Transcript_19448:1481-2224(+)